MLSRHHRWLSVVLLLMVLLVQATPASAAAKKPDLRKVVIASADLSSDWSFYRKYVTTDQVSRQFRPVGYQIFFASAARYKTPAAAKAAFQLRMTENPESLEIHRPAPRAKADAWGALGGVTLDYAYTLYYTVVGDTVLSVQHFLFWEIDYQGLSGDLLRCEALQINRLRRPNAAGNCPIKVKETGRA